MLVITEDPGIIFGLRIESWQYFPEDQILCVTKDGYEKIMESPISDLLEMKSETWEERAKKIKRLFKEFYGEHNFNKLEERKK